MTKYSDWKPLVCSGLPTVRAKDDHYADLAKVRFDAKEVVIA
jgi:hypothetical protein